MLMVRTLSVFFPSSMSACMVCADAAAVATPSSVVASNIVLIVSLPVSPGPNGFGSFLPNWVWFVLQKKSSPTFLYQNGFGSFPRNARPEPVAGLPAAESKQRHRSTPFQHARTPSRRPSAAPAGHRDKATKPLCGCGLAVPTVISDCPTRWLSCGASGCSPGRDTQGTLPVVHVAPGWPSYPYSRCQTAQSSFFVPGALLRPVLPLALRPIRRRGERTN